MQAGAFRDNAVVPFAGVCAADLTDAQRRRLRALVAAYVGWAAEGHSGVKMREVHQHLDETYFAWMGAVADDGPFYYRVHSPVVLIEFDHHPGVAFDNVVPSLITSTPLSARRTAATTVSISSGNITSGLITAPVPTSPGQEHHRMRPHLYAVKAGGVSLPCR